jgi:hypothetical protein
LEIKTAPHPPIPGLGEHAPSVKILTEFLGIFCVNLSLAESSISEATSDYDFKLQNVWVFSAA